MALRTNIIANYVGTGYNLLIGIVILPLYLGYMGAEAYGLVGFFTLMQVWLNILDLGLSPTLNRQAASAASNPNGYQQFVAVLKSFELIFCLLGVVTLALIVCSSPWMSEHWFKAAVLSADEIRQSLQLMGAIIALRWLTALYRSGILGFEYQVWNNVVSSVYASFRFIGSLLLVAYISNDILHFFYYQLALAIVEFVVLRSKLYGILPKGLDLRWRFDWAAVKSVAPFALGVAYTAGLWVAVTQLDKLILSTLLPLQQFGYFSLVTVICSGLLHITFPVSVAIQPRLTALLAQGKVVQMLQLYRLATRFVAVVSGAVVVVMVVYAEPLLLAWTGDPAAASWGAQVLVWFALGNAMLTLGTFQYYLQFAYGSMRLHVIGSTVAAILQVPVIFYAAQHYGALGAGVSWFAFRSLFFLIWPPIVHHKFSPGLHWRWLVKEVMPAVIASMSLIWLWPQLWPLSLQTDRLLLVVQLMALSAFTLAVMLAVGFGSVVLKRRKPVLQHLTAASDEAAISRQWTSTEPLVSICCITYNQVGYIRQTLDSFLAQQTRFAFEIIVHDDASTDGTREIVAEYAKRYPGIIHAVLQQENQYRQGRQVSPNFVWPKARGHYIALCEGDDFWTSPHKLQLQVDALSQAPDCDICFHPSIELFPDASVARACVIARTARRVSFTDVIRGGGGYMPTASILIRSAILQQLPDWFSQAPVGDYYLQMLGAKRGGAVFLPQVMCCYRRSALNSWTVQMKAWSKAKLRSIAEAHCLVLQAFATDCHAHNRPAISAAFNYARARELMLMSVQAVRSGHFDTARQLITRSWQAYRFAGSRQVILYILRARLPWLLQLKRVSQFKKAEVSDE